MSERVDKFRAIEQAALIITSELSLDAVIRKIIDTARDLVHARYAAFGVARQDLRGLSQFIVSGITDERIAAIGNWPRGLGLFGELLRNPRPLRVRVIGEHPSSIGFPPHHPKMTTFLGVPIMSKGRVLGNCYLTEKVGAKECSKADEEVIVAFAAFAAVAIENARLYTETDMELRGKMREAQRREEQLRFLVELSALLPGGPIVEELPLEAALAKATTLLGDACGAYLVDPDGHITRKAFAHRDPARAKSAEDLIDETWNVIRDQVLDKNMTVFVADVDLISAPMPAESLDVKEKREPSMGARRPVEAGAGVSESLEQCLQVFTTAWRRGVVASSNPQVIGVDASDREYFRVIAQGQEWALSDLLQARVGGEPVFAVARGIERANLSS